MALNNFIKIDRTNPAATESGELLAFKNMFRQAYEMGLRIRAKMRHTFDDSGGAGTINWTAVQTNWGIPTNGTTVGPTANGAVVFTLVDGAVGAMEGVFQNSSGKDVTETVG